MSGTTLRPIVHIGYHKTATTWLQDKVWPTATSHDWIPRKVTQAALLNVPGMSFAPADAARVLGLAERTKPVLLSEENLSGYIHNGGLQGCSRQKWCGGLPQSFRKRRS